MLEAIAILNEKNNPFYIRKLVEKETLSSIIAASVDMLEAKMIQSSFNSSGHIYTCPQTGDTVFTYSSFASSPFKVLFVYGEKSEVKYKDIQSKMEELYNRANELYLNPFYSLTSNTMPTDGTQVKFLGYLNSI